MSAAARKATQSTAANSKRLHVRAARARNSTPAGRQRVRDALDRRR
jgi:hypothetical protein